MILRAVLSLAVIAGLASVGRAQPASDAPTTVQEVVVTARRSGVPVWRIGSDHSALVVVGAIGNTPRDLVWRSAELESAVVQARRVYVSGDLDITAADVLRLLFTARRHVELPRGQTLDQVLDPALASRLSAHASAGRLPRGYNRQRPWFVAGEMLESLEREVPLHPSDAAEEAVRRAAKRARLPVQPLVRLRLSEAVKTVGVLRPEDERCLQALADALDGGEAGVRSRADAWTRTRIAEVASSPLSQAERSCWPESDPGLAHDLRQAWRETARRELAVPGVVVGVAPLSWLTEPGGLLDMLEAEGHPVEGPAWRADG